MCIRDSEIALLNELFGMPEEMYAVGQSFREEIDVYKRQDLEYGFSILVAFVNVMVILPHACYKSMILRRGLLV